MYAFTYHRPRSLREAASLLAKTEDAKFIAGGHSLLPVMKQRLAAPPALIDLAGIPGLASIERTARSVVIGAMTKHVEVETSPAVKEAIPAMTEMVSVLGDPAVRNRGTLGGSVAGNDPSTDWPAAVLGLGAIVVTNRRKIHADEFFKGLFETALEPDEIVTKVSFPIPQKAAYKKFRHPASRYALVGVFVAKRSNEIRVAVTGAGSNGVFRWSEAEQALAKRFAPKSVEGLTASPDGLNSDIHADAEYRAHLIGVMARRAVQAAVER
jgi:aerobic carbon-monoxide dehydrogenase medium subunit